MFWTPHTTTHTQEYLDEWKANAKKYSLNYVDIRVYKWESKKIASKKETPSLQILCS
jgi:hypothetical protein